MATALQETARDTKEELRNLTDEELCDRVADTQDETAFTILYNRHANALREYILFRVGYDEMEADDILSITFMRVYKFARSRNRKGTFFSWLYVIAVHLCTDYSRNIRQTSHLSFPTTDKELADFNSPSLVEEQSAYSVEENIIREEDIGFLRKDIRRLPEKLRLILLLYIVHDIPGKEVAEILHSTPGAVKMNACRARKYLRALREERESAILKHPKR